MNSNEFDPSALTPRRLDALRAAIEVESERGSPLRLADLAERLDISVVSARDLLLSLVESGYMRREPRGERGGAGTYRVALDETGRTFDRDAAHRAWLQNHPADGGEPVGSLHPLKGAAAETARAAVRAYHDLRRPVTVFEIARARGGKDPRATGDRVDELVGSGHLKRSGELILPLYDHKGAPVAPAPPSRATQSSEGAPLRESVRALLEMAIDTMERPVDTELIPIRGVAAAGLPIDAVAEGELDSLEVPSSWTRGAASYLLRVTGDSMAGDFIADGDLVLVRATEAVEPGKIHVVWTPSGATIKRVEEGELVPSNPDHPRRPVPEGSVPQGRVVAVLRFLD